MTEQQTAQIAMLAVQKLERIAKAAETIAKLLDDIDTRLFELAGNFDSVIGSDEDEDDTDADIPWYVRVRGQGK